MGTQICCQVQQTENKFRGDLYKLEAFEPVSILASDPIIQQWLSENSMEDITIQREEKFMKLKNQDVYYFCKWVNSLAEGKGFVYKPNVIFFSGDFKSGVPEGYGIVKFLTQSCQYQGQVKSWRANGNGTLYNTKGNYKISGLWENSKLKSANINFNLDPNISSIQISSFQKCQGNISYKDNRWYQGQIDQKKLVPHGIGKVTFPFNSPKQFYEGEWYCGQICGKGKLVYSNKTSYEGEFFEGQREGLGKFNFENGTYFEGYWHKGKQLGVGALYNIIGDATKYGIWQNGKLKNEITKQQWESLMEISRSKKQDLIDDSQIISETDMKIKATESSYNK